MSDDRDGERGHRGILSPVHELQGNPIENVRFADDQVVHVQTGPDPGLDERSAGVHRGEHEREIAEAERGPQDEYKKAVDQASREDVGAKKPSDEAQAEDEDAEEAEGDK